jgi:hypothetical protein
MCILPHWSLFAGFAVTLPPHAEPGSIRVSTAPLTCQIPLPSGYLQQCYRYVRLRIQSCSDRTLHHAYFTLHVVSRTFIA